MPDATTAKLTDAVRVAAHSLIGALKDYTPLMELIGDACFVLIGEASHGTHEFYEQRAEITKRLIQEKGFTAVAVEADWPDAYQVNRYVRGTGSDVTATEALEGFRSFPAWMWRNKDVLNFVNWLRRYNDKQLQDITKVGFYGLDLYSMHTSIDAVLKYLDQVDPEAAQQARSRYACFEHFEGDTQIYGYATSAGLIDSCQDGAVKQLVELQRRMVEYIQRDGSIAKDDFFYAEQNARLVKNAEEYYRSLFHGHMSSWNVRDRHMAETLDRLFVYLDKPQNPAKIVVWEHNSHIGDARATDMGKTGELNVGQLVRERYGHKVVLVGCSTYTGTVTAASDWGGPTELKQVRPALPGSYESLFHNTGLPCFLLNLRQGGLVTEGLQKPRLERAIGVIYLPETERASHYFSARLSEQFDAVIHFDNTRAVEPLERDDAWETNETPEEIPETFPFAL